MPILKFLDRQLRRAVNRQLKEMSSLTTPLSQPNLNALSLSAGNVRLLELNVKAFGYELARRMAETLPPPGDTVEQLVGLRSKASTQEDLESGWAAHWVSQLKVPAIYHRKIWELAYILQAVHEHGHMQPGARALGFACGVEPLASYFASRGISVTATDLHQASAIQTGWVSSNQHAASVKQVFHPHLVAEDVFDSLVTFREVDMNAIPSDLEGYDFCWSTCAVEHLGSIENGLAFMRNALATLRPGGLSVHTLEFNVENGDTIDNWPTVLFQRSHIESLTEALRGENHEVVELDFDFGNNILDKFIDVPPYQSGSPDDLTMLVGLPLHLKLGIDGFVSTCFGMIVRKAS